MDRMSRRIDVLRRCATQNPIDQNNIEAVIRYYEAGGRLAIPGREVLYCFDGETAKVGSLEDFRDEHWIRKTAGWMDVRGLLRLARLFSQKLTKLHI